MDIKTETFGTLTQAAFDKSVKYLTQVGKRIAIEFDTVVTFAVAAMFNTGDVTHVNKVLPILHIAKLGPMVERVLVGFEIVPFNFDKQAFQFTGKINVGRAAALKLIVAGVPQWEGLLKAALAGEKPENKAKQAFNLESRMDSLIKAARKNGSTSAEITAAYASAKRKHPADSTMLDPANQQLVKDNAANHAAHVAVAVANAA